MCPIPLSDPIPKLNDCRFCSLPAGVSAPFSCPVKPVITSVSFGAYSVGSVLVTSSNSSPTLSGYFFNAYGVPSVSYSCDFNPSLRFPCPVTSSSSDGFSVTCSLAAAPPLAARVGANCRFLVTTGSVESDVFSSVTFGFPAPTVAPGSLRRGLEGPRFASLPAVPRNMLPETVCFDGANLGSNREAVKVTYGPADDASRYQCDVTLVTVSTLCCLVAIQGEGTRLTFSANVAGQIATGTDVYNYPNLPKVSRVEGCTRDSDPTRAMHTVDCPTKPGDGFRIQVFGESLTSPLEIEVGGMPCTGTVYDEVSSAYITCLLPEGTGRNLAVTCAQFGALFANPPTGETDRRL